MVLARAIAWHIKLWRNVPAYIDPARTSYSPAPLHKHATPARRNSLANWHSSIDITNSLAKA